MTPKIITSIPELLDVFRERRDELDVGHLTIDGLAGLSDGHVGKLLAPNATKGLGEISLRCLLSALALSIVEIKVVEDPEQAARMSHRWLKRRRAPSKPPASPQLGASLNDQTCETPIGNKENADEV